MAQLTVETVCPECHTPRPSGAQRCVCNYTFEYGAPSFDQPRRAAGSSRVRLALLGIAGLAAAAAFAFVPSIDAPQGLTLPGLVLALAGPFAVSGAVFDWNWFMNHRKARRFVWLIGRPATRFFYALLGGGLTGAGIRFLVSG